MQEIIQQLDAKREVACLGGGQERIDKQHAKGTLVDAGYSIRRGICGGRPLRGGDYPSNFKFGNLLLFLIDALYLERYNAIAWRGSIPKKSEYSFFLAGVLL